IGPHRNLNLGPTKYKKFPKLIENFLGSKNLIRVMRKQKDNLINANDFWYKINLNMEPRITN
ncbi:hypothetical protein L9F63_014563, partial [Diploptera punctata]